MPYVLMVQDNHIRLYRSQKELGESQYDLTETYIECRPSLLSEENLGYLSLIFSAKALSEKSSLSEILENSKRFSADATTKLKDRIYKEYVRDTKTLSCFKPRIAFRDVGSADRPRTIHVSLLPPKVFLVHKAPYLLFPRGDEKDEAFLLGVLSSFPCDWYARRFVATHLKFFLLNTFPIPRPSRTNPLWKRAVALSGRLASPDKRFAKWAKVVGVECGPLDPNTKNKMIHELDAVVAHLYGLSEKQLIHIFDTFHKNKEYYADRKQAVLKYYQSWNLKKTA